MGKLTEMEAKLRKGPSMLGHAKFHERLQGHVIELATSVDALTAEHDRLRKDLNDIGEDYHRLATELAAANDTLDRLRQAVPEVLPPHMSWKDSLDGTRAILYPPDMTNEDR